MPAANMGLTKPVDGDTNNVWGPMLNTDLDLIGDHNHTAGQGTKIPSAALNINADVSWSSSGISWSITDVNAIDFKAVAAGVVVGFAGALFVNSADSELYWRTIGGTNVKVTAGAALNVAAFTGGIGGDYSAAGALVVFDDATDSYWFQQQVGAAVRQYARMRSADVDLYEYKANPAAGVPVNRVRLASPTALASSYALTLPAALPIVTRPLQVNSTGSILVNDPIVRSFSTGLWALGPSGGTFNNTVNLPDVVLGTSAGANYAPLTVNVGETITAWSVSLTKNSSTGTITAKLFQRVTSTAVQTQLGSTQSNGAASPGIISLGQSSLSFLVASGVEYGITLNGGGSATPANDFVGAYSVTVT